jgi:ubiquinone/menaquinone biosynthesis C-methylase UbiE
MAIERKNICSVEHAGGLDNSARKFLQNPDKILKPYIQPGMIVLDVGCGPGFFSIEIAKLLNGSGKVIAADLQQGMLDIIHEKIKGTKIEYIIELHKCEEEKIGISEPVDFIFACMMVHEGPNASKLFNEFKQNLKPNGTVLIAEPKFHVSKKSFEEMIEKLNKIGFEIIDKPKITLCRSILIKLKYN